VPVAIELDHVAVAVEQYRDALKRYGGELAGQWMSGGLADGFAPGQLRYANGMKLELLRPHRVDRNDFLRRFLDRNGPGPHHLTFKVPDLDALLATATANGYEPINVNRVDPDWQEAFLHPKAIPGVLVQVAQVRGPDWVSPAPEGWPEAQTSVPARLLHVTHAVRDLDEGLRLFAGLLGGRECDRGHGGTDPWVELRWPGPGRLRLVQPGSADSEVAGWVGERSGRIHHLAFACERPDRLQGAVGREDGSWEVSPEANLGVRLILYPLDHVPA
jgi:catechol 2,3-dioxygenase-like lactoylglutathione lyase family enzyme